MNFSSLSGKLGQTFKYYFVFCFVSVLFTVLINVLSASFTDKLYFSVVNQSDKQSINQHHAIFFYEFLTITEFYSFSGAGNASNARF